MTTQKNDEYKYAMQEASNARNYFHNHNGSLVHLCYFLEALNAAIVAKGYSKGYSKNIEYDVCDGTIKLRMYFYDKDNDGISIHVTVPIAGHEVVAGMDRMYTEVSQLQYSEDRARVKWKQKLADLVTEGENLNIGVEYTRMLEETAKKLSSNALEGPRE